MVANWQRGVLMAMGVKNYAAEVVGITDFTPWYRRIRLSVPGFLDGFVLHPTVWVRLWVPSLAHDKLVQRGYTIVDPDPIGAQFSLDFVLHEPTGPATKWARDARLGSTAEVAHTPQRLTIDPHVRTLVLAGDATALPAINTLLESAPKTAVAYVALQDDHGDRDALPLLRDARTTVVWAAANEGGRSVVTVLQASVPQQIRPEGTYLWAAGERMLVKSVREHARGRLGLARHNQHTQNYWIRGYSAS